MSLLTGFIRFAAIISLLIVSFAWTPFAYAAPDAKPPEATDKGDLNRDGVINYDDLVIFSSRFLEVDVADVDWCTFVTATNLEDDLYGRPPKYYIKHFSDLLNFINSSFCTDSDFNKDGLVDLTDLMIFSHKYLELYWKNVDWCDFYKATAMGELFNDRSTKYYQEHFKTLQGFIQDHFLCYMPHVALLVENQPRSLNRGAVTTDSEGNTIYLFSDPRVGSVFIFDSDFTLTGELKNLSKPLGLAIDSNGYLLVGNSRHRNIEIYDPNDGAFLGSFGEGMIRKANAITIGPLGKIYITDSKSHHIHVFDSAYVSLGTIGSYGEDYAGLDFPIDSAIVSRSEGETTVHELYVADQGNKRIQVYDLNGKYLDTIFAPPAVELPKPDPWVDNNGDSCSKYFCDPDDFWCNYFPPPPPPPECESTTLFTEFSRLQAIDADSQGQLHIVDIFEPAAVVIDISTGGLVGSYGGVGEGPGLVNNPADILLIEGDRALVTEIGSDDIEVFAVQ